MKKLILALGAFASLPAFAFDMTQTTAAPIKCPAGYRYYQSHKSVCISPRDRIGNSTVIFRDPADGVVKSYKGCRYWFGRLGC